MILCDRVSTAASNRSSCETSAAIPLFSEFSVKNPKSESIYRVAIRGSRLGENFCSCPDFATNDLGTCKHIEFVLGRLERKRGAAKALASGFAPSYSEIYLRYGGERGVHLRVGAECPPGLKRSAAKLFDEAADWRLPAAAFLRLDDFLSRAQKSKHEVRCYEDALAFVARARIRRARPRRGVSPPGTRGGVPRRPAQCRARGLVKTTLYEYQAEGALFAAREGRVLIGDDMGLGKTEQAIAATELMAKHFGAERVLIVCPVSRATSQCVHGRVCEVQQRYSAKSPLTSRNCPNLLIQNRFRCSSLICANPIKSIRYA